MCPIPNGFRDIAIRMHNRKVVHKKEILRLRSVSNTGIYCSSDRVGTVYNKCSKIPPSASILDVRMTGQNYLDFLQTNYRMFLWLHGSLCTFSMTEPLLIIPDMWCNISMTLSLIGGSDVAVPLTGHQDLQTYPVRFLFMWFDEEWSVQKKKWIHETNCSLTYWMLSPA